MTLLTSTNSLLLFFFSLLDLNSSGNQYQLSLPSWAQCLQLRFEICVGSRLTCISHNALHTKGLLKAARSRKCWLGIETQPMSSLVLVNSLLQFMFRSHQVFVHVIYLLDFFSMFIFSHSRPNAKPKLCFQMFKFARKPVSGTSLTLVLFGKS